MPLVRVELFERRLTPELESRLIDAPDRRAARDARGAGAPRAHLGDRRGPRRPPLGPRRQALGRSRADLEPVLNRSRRRARARPAARRGRPRPPRARAAASCARSASRARSCRAPSAPARPAGRARSRRRCAPIWRYESSVSDGAMPKSSRLSSGCRSARWISAVPFDCSPTAMPRAREQRAVVPDERDVGRTPDAHEPRRRALLAHAVERSPSSTSACGRPLIVSPSAPPNAGPTAITTSSGAAPRCGRPELARPRARPAVARAEQPRVDRVRQLPQPLPALALEAVAGARARCSGSRR